MASYGARLWRTIWTREPHWQTIIDYDALAKQDKQEWVANGFELPLPRQYPLPGIAFSRR